MKDTALTYPVKRALAEALSAHGVEVMFGLMGDANMFMVDEFVRRCGGRFVPAAHEGSGVLMAQAYSRVSGKIGVATATHGPALTNCVTALTEAARGSVPMVLMVGDTPVSKPRHSQSIDQREVVKVTGAGFVQLRSPETVAKDVAHAFYMARVERRPVVLNMPADFMWLDAPEETHVFDVFPAPIAPPEGDVMDEAVGMIASAKRPMILAGQGAIPAREALVALADRLDAPLATTLKAMGLFAGHPYEMGIFGTLSSPATYEAIASSDCIIAFGASLHDFTTDQGKLMAGKRVVQVDLEPRAIGGGLHPDAAILADAARTAETILYWLNEADIPGSGFTAELDGAALRHHPIRPDRTAPGCLNYERALERLNDTLPKDRLLVTDGGRFMTEVWVRLTVSGPDASLPTVDFGSIGLGLQEAIGAGMADPTRPVVLFTGDGGFMMGGMTELNTAVRMGLDLTVIVANDSAYGAEHIQFIDRQMDPSLSEFDWPSFADIGAALGGTGYRVTTLAELDTALEQSAAQPGVRVIELVLDPNDVPRMRI